MKTTTLTPTGEQESRQTTGYFGRLQAFLDRSELTRTLSGFKKEFRAVGVFSLVVNLLMLTPTIFLLQLFDRFMISQNMLTLIVLCIIVVYFYLVLAFSEWVRSRLLVRIGVKMDKALSPRIFHAAFEANLRGDHHAAREALTDLTQLRQFITGNGTFAFFDAPWSPIYLIVLCLLSPWLGLLAVIFALFFITLAIVTQKLSLPSQKATLEASQQENRFAVSKLRNAEAIESMGMLGALRQRWLGRHREHLASLSVSSDAGQRVAAVTKFFTHAQQSLVLGAAALLVIEGAITIGALIAANVLMGRVLAPINIMVSSWQGLFRAREAFYRLEKLLADYPERTGKLTPTELSPAIKLENLTAKAPDGKRVILADISAEFPAGTVTTIIGPSGSGKSTLARCLLGIWPETEGRVLLDGEPVQRWNREELGEFLGYLPQDVELFEGSIAENIARFGDVDPDKVIQACQTAGLHEMILRFPKGYDTPIAESGLGLSGGQRQRIGLARAIYGNPSLIILDEPNANLDSDGENALHQAVSKLRSEGKSIFLITHRPQIIGLSDQLMVLAQGCIQHYGPRDEVIRALQAPQTANA